MASIRRSNDLFPTRWEEEEDVHVLAVDDSVVDRKVIERLLKITSCKVTTVESGWRALQYLGLIDQDKTNASLPPRHDDLNVVNGLKVDLIITDYCMPGMTGYELLKKIKGSATFREVPVVIMSSENVVARIDRCLEEGAEDFIVKPVKLSDVRRLKDYMFGGDNTHRGTIPAATTNNNQEEKTITTSCFNKRKLQEMSSSSSSPSTSPTMSPSSTSQSPPPTTSSSSSSSTPPMSPDPFSPSQLESPTMRLKVTNSDYQV